MFRLTRDYILGTCLYPLPDFGMGIPRTLVHILSSLEMRLQRHAKAMYIIAEMQVSSSQEPHLLDTHRAQQYLRNSECHRRVRARVEKRFNPGLKA